MDPLPFPTPPEHRTFGRFSRKRNPAPVQKTWLLIEIAPGEAIFAYCNPKNMQGILSGELCPEVFLTAEQALDFLKFTAAGLVSGYRDFLNKTGNATP